MTRYEDLLAEAAEKGMIVKEKQIPGYEGRICGNRIAISRDIDTERRKAEVLAEEIAHFETGVGDILDQDTPDKRKQELHARGRAYDRLVGLIGIIQCYRQSCRNLHDMAEALNCTEPFIRDALKYYEGKYGKEVRLDQYLIRFDPLQVMEMF